MRGPVLCFKPVLPGSKNILGIINFMALTIFLDRIQKLIISAVE